MSGQTYDPKQNIVTLGVIVVDGFADGDAITVERNGPGVTTKVGVAGEWAFQESADQSGVIRLRLMATAAMNKVLLAQYKAGNLPVPLSITNVSTAEIEVSASVKIQREPDKAYGAEVGVREWVLVAGELTSL